MKPILCLMFFQFKDGDKNITLRYDLSSPLARFVAQNNQELPTIYKRYAIQNVFRNEKPGNGRYREFLQADFDIIGNTNPAQSNAELCNLISATLLECGLKKDQFTINVSNRKIVQGLIDELNISSEKPFFISSLYRESQEFREYPIEYFLQISGEIFLFSFK